MTTPRPRILLVEDDPAMVQMIQMGLRYAGFDVLVATTGSDGLDWLTPSTPTWCCSTGCCRGWTA
jgi:DNA-binding response OmpR family regulator